MTDEEIAFELWIWHSGAKRKEGLDNFHALLFTLISKADLKNLWKLKKGFPNEVRLFHEWQATIPESRFWEKYGVPK